MTDAGQDKRWLLPVLLLFYLSGALALVYQVVWSRMMMHIFGSTALAVGTVLAAFMSGMAVGAWYFGKTADRSPNLLRLYALLEIGIAVFAVGSHLLLNWMNSAYPAIFAFFGSSDAVFAVVRFVLAFVLVMAPTVLMGATLPVLARLLVNRRAAVGVNLSSLYAINTFGAVSGVLLTGFLLIGRYGIHLPVYGAAAGNLLIGLAAAVLARRTGLHEAASLAPGRPEPRAGQGGESALGRGSWRLILAGLGISGFTSFAYEIYWTRSLVFILGNSTYALTTMLAAFLTGIALGGWLIRYLFDRVADRAALFGWIQVALGVFSALALPILFSFSDPRSLGLYFAESSGQALPLLIGGFGISFLVMLVPATLIGATFPLVGEIGVRDLRETGAAVGRIYSVNTLGNVAGALLPGFLLISWLGIQKGILAMAVLNVLLGFAVLFLRLARSTENPSWRFALPVFALLAAGLMSQAPLQFQFPSEGEFQRHQTLFYHEGPLATTKVFHDPLSGEKQMSVDGIVIGGTGNTEFKQLLLAHLPKLLLEDISTELSVGVGSAMLLGESLRHPGVQSLTGVEIEPGVVRGAEWFATENHGVLSNPKLHIVIDDIGNFLRTTSGRYQVISADEKTADEYASNGFSYSLEYYELLRQHLAPGGLVAQWVPATLPPRQLQLVLNTFCSSFPRVQLWYFLPAHQRGPFNSILIGSHKPVAIDPALIQRRLRENPAAIESLEPYGLTSAEALLPHFVAREDVLCEAVAAAPLNRFDHPRYEFFHPWDYALDRQAKTIENHEFLLDLKRRAHPGFLAELEEKVRDMGPLRQSFAAEFHYLEGFGGFLQGMSLAEQYRTFDSALATAPWNDSLRARIYAQYRYIASTQADPAERARLMRRARGLYDAR